MNNGTIANTGEITAPPLLPVPRPSTANRSIGKDDKLKIITPVNSIEHASLVIRSLRSTSHSQVLLSY